jgi:hypothetical protein
MQTEALPLVTKFQLVEAPAEESMSVFRPPFQFAFGDMLVHETWWLEFPVSYNWEMETNKQLLVDMG